MQRPLRVKENPRFAQGFLLGKAIRARPGCRGSGRSPLVQTWPLAVQRSIVLSSQEVLKIVVKSLSRHDEVDGTPARLEHTSNECVRRVGIYFDLSDATAVTEIFSPGAWWLIAAVFEVVGAVVNCSDGKVVFVITIRGGLWNKHDITPVHSLHPEKNVIASARLLAVWRQPFN